MRKPEFNVFKGKDGQFYFNLKAPNYEIILQSEGYKAKSGAINGVKSVQANCSDENNYDKRESRDGQFYFVLKAKNSEIIGVSETYTTKRAMLDGIEDVKRYGVTTIVNGTNETLHKLRIDSRKVFVKPGNWLRSEILKLVDKVGMRFCLFRIKENGTREEIREEKPLKIDTCMVFVVVAND